MDTSEITKHFTADEALTLPDLWYNSARSVSHPRCRFLSLMQRLYGVQTSWRITPWKASSV